MIDVALNGLAYGCMVGLAAMSVTLIYRVSHFANVAVGDMMTLGAFIALAVSNLMSFPIWLAGCITIVVMAVVGAIAYELLFRPIRDRTLALFATSIGLALALRALVQYFWGTNVQTYAVASGSLTISGVHLSYIFITILIVTSACVLSLFLMLRYARIGKLIRALSDSELLVRLAGARARRLVVVVWAIASALMGISGVLIGLNGALTPELGWNILLDAFAAAILGGFGNTFGAIVGGIVIGEAGQFSVLILPTGYKPAIAFAVIIAVLLLRPRGLLAPRVRV